MFPFTGQPILRVPYHEGHMGPTSKKNPGLAGAIFFWNDNEFPGGNEPHDSRKKETMGDG